MGLLPPRWKNSDPDKAANAVGRLKDQQTLFAIVSDASAHYKVREAAANRLTDQRLLFDIVMQPYNIYASCALDGITDQALLVSIIRQSENSSFRERVISCIDDETVLTEIAENDTSPLVRATAHRKLGNDSQADTLTALNAGSASQRYVAVSSGTIAQDVLLQICQSDCDEDVRHAAFSRLTGASDIAYLAAKAVDPDVREMALKKAPDNQQIFIKAALHSKSAAAFDRLKPEGLLTVFVKCRDISCRDKAGRQLISLSEGGQTSWVETVDADTLQKLICICFEQQSGTAGALLMMIYKSGRFMDQVGCLSGRVIIPEHHTDAHREYYDLGDHMDFGHTDTMEPPAIFHLEVPEEIQ